VGLQQRVIERLDPQRLICRKNGRPWTPPPCSPGPSSLRSRKGNGRSRCFLGRGRGECTLFG
jgi:hypothetical protein